jgi:hypothetical protein
MRIASSNPLNNAEIDAMSRLGVRVAATITARNQPPSSSHVCRPDCHYGWDGTIERIESDGITVAITAVHDCAYCWRGPGRRALPILGESIIVAWRDILIGDRTGLAAPPIHVRP